MMFSLGTSQQMFNYIPLIMEIKECWVKVSTLKVIPQHTRFYSHCTVTWTYMT